MSSIVPIQVAYKAINLAYTESSIVFDILSLVSYGSGTFTYSITQPPVGYGTIFYDQQVWGRFQYSKPLTVSGTFSVTLTVTDTAENRTASNIILFTLAAASSSTGGSGDYSSLTSFAPVGGSVSTAYLTPVNVYFGSLDGISAFAASHGFSAGNLSHTIVAYPTHGNVTTLVAGSSVAYTPFEGYVGTDSFTYKYSYTSGSTIYSALGTIYITVSSPVIPDPVDDYVTTTFNTPIVISPLVNDAGSAPITITSATVPSGGGTVVVQSGNTTLLYTPPTNSSGGYTVSYVVQDAQGDTATGLVHVSVLPASINPSIVISPAGSLLGTAGTAVSRQYTATGGTGPYTYVPDALPAGLSLSSSGLLSGTPTALSVGDYKIVANDSAGGYNNLFVPYSIASSVSGTLVITAPTVYGAIGVPLNAVLSASGTSIQSYVWTFSALPPGVTRTADSTAVGLTGTPTSIGTTAVTVTVRTNETYPVYATTTFNIVITATETTARADSFTLANRAAETILDVLANDTGSTFTLVRCTQPAAGKGTARIFGGSLYYKTQDTDLGYTATFSYVTTDSNSVERTATVTVVVAAAGVSNSLSNGVLTVTRNTKKVIVGANEFLALFGTSNSYISALVSLTGASHGVAVLSGVDGTFAYTPTTDYTGTDVLTLTATNITGASLTATLTLTIAAAATLTITPASVIADTYVGDIYSQDLFTVQGGVSPYRLAGMTVTPGLALLTTGQNEPSSFLSIPLSVANTSAAYSVGISRSFPKVGFYTITLNITDGSAAPAQVAASSVIVKVLGQDGAAPDPGTNPANPSTGVISGTLRLDTSLGAFAARKVYLYSYTTGAKVAEVTSNATTGAWEFTAVAAGSYFVVGASLDSEPTRDFDAMGVITVI